MGAAAAGAVAVIGVMGEVVQNTELPTWTFHQTLNLVVWGFLGTCVVAWFHGERGRQEVSRLEVVILGVMAVSWAATSVMLFLP